MELRPQIEEKRWKVAKEAEILDSWEREGTFAFHSDSNKTVFSIDTPPPYASGRWHVGGATHYSQIDMVARYNRMKGYEVLFAFGIDRNGLPVEMEVEKKHNIRAFQTPREKFIDLCKNYLDTVESEILNTAKKLGMSSDFKNAYRTDSPEYRRLTQDTFIELWHKGLVYEDDRPTNWCPVCDTTIADAEIEYVHLPTQLVYMKFNVKEGGEVVVATTRPELIVSCATLIYNPDDERYLKLEGKHAITPVYGSEVPIIPSQYAKPDFGSGIAMICSYGDHTDIRLFRELNLVQNVAINEHGRMKQLAGELDGLKVAEARKKMIQSLEESGLLVKKEQINHSTPVCWRTKNPIEFINMPEYYLKQMAYIAPLLDAADKMEFHPEDSKQILLNWINSVNSDWPISRRRYYGTEIPLWYCKSCKKPYVPEAGRYYQPWREKPNSNCDCGSSEFVGETRTFDTWFDSGISNLYVVGFKRKEDLFKKAFPCSLRPQGADIVRTWLFYSMLRTHHLLSRPPFQHVRISGMGLDEKGEAMHKSKGNVVWPEPILEKYGVDAFRLWGATEAKLGSTYRFSQERLEGSFRFITKLWNISRFISSFPVQEQCEELNELDRMLLGELNDTIKECIDGYEAMDLFVPAQALRGFVWNLFADHYLEAAKARAYNLGSEFAPTRQKSAWYTLHFCLKTILKLLAPLCPFVTDALWKSLYSTRSVHTESIPSPDPDWKSSKDRMKKFVEFNSAVWKYKKDHGMALNDKVTEVYGPSELEPLSEDLRAMHKIQNVILSATKPENPDGLEKAGDLFIVR